MQIAVGDMLEIEGGHIFRSGRMRTRQVIELRSVEKLRVANVHASM